MSTLVFPPPVEEVAIPFLKRVQPDGPWCLTAIEKDRKTIETRTFGPGSGSKLTDWLAKENGGRNLYWTVGVVGRPLTSKAGEEDLVLVRYLHVDVDPRAGEDPVAERVRILALFTTKLPKGVPAPTIIVASGGGYQAFWELLEPIPVETNEQVAEVKRYNVRLRDLFGGDNCQSLDHLMRLPGTVNIAGAKKVKAGRVDALAEVVSDTKVCHALSAFTPAPPRPAAEQAPAVSIDVSAMRRIANTDELDEWGVTDHLKMLIVQGHDADNPKPKDNSSSAWLMDVLCNLLRLTTPPPDEVLYSLITDPTFGISAHVLGQKKNRQHKYALRQIAKAKEWVIDPWLMKMNEKYAVIQNLGGKCRVIEVNPPDNQPFSKQGKDDFCNAWCHVPIEVGKKDGVMQYRPLGSWWYHHKQRRLYSRVAFIPGDDAVVPADVFNLWRGFAVDAVPGDCQMFLDLVRDIICARNVVHYDFLIRWMARAVQHPAEQGHVAIVLRGGQGIGKSFFADMFGSLFGRHFLAVTNERHITGNFNAHLREAVVLFGDEALVQQTGILKALITAPSFLVEAKGIDSESADNHTHLILASNNRKIVEIAGDDRRMFVMDVSAARVQDTAYFGALAEQMTNGGGREALLHYLKNLDLTGWNPRVAPTSAAKDDLKNLSLRGAARVVYDLLASGEATYYDKKDDAAFVETSALVPDDESSVNVQALAPELAKAAGRKSTRATLGGEQRRGYWMPGLDVARENFAKAYGRAMPWPEDDKQWVGAPEVPF